MSSSMLAQALLDYGSDSDENIADQADELPLLEDSAKNDTTTEIMYAIRNTGIHFISLRFSKRTLFTYLIHTFENNFQAYR